MDSDYDTDYATEAPLPSPSGTLYRTPSHLSLQSNHPPSPAPFPPSNNPSNLGTNPKRMSMSHHEPSFNENISILDPRRFTPTLHANLVAEILNLRRELESKSSFIDQLEHDLASSKTEHETAVNSAATAVKEAREVKRQLARAEQDDAMVVMAQERDDAVKSLSEVRKQMDRVSKARRIAEDDLKRIKRIQESDSERFDGARKALERRALVAEGRLKAVLDEIAAMPPPPTPGPHERLEGEETDQNEGVMSDAGSVRNSLISLRGQPTSLSMGDDEAGKLGNSLNMAMHNGLSLADELNFHDDESEEDEEEHSDDETEHAEDDATLSCPEDMVTDVESIDDVDELPEFAEIGIQVVPEFDTAERIRELEELLDEKDDELETTYAALDQKSNDLDLTHAELDRSNGKVLQLEAKVQILESDALEGTKRIAEMEAKHAQDVKIFEARGREVEERWFTLENKSTSLQLKEQKLDELSSVLTEKEKTLSDREQELLALSKKTASEQLENERSLTEENRSKDGEYEANARRKRSSGIISPPPTTPRASTPAYVSTAMQTPGDTPPPVPPKTFVKSCGIQTEPMRPAPLATVLLPAITVSPPPPTPPLPLPPKPVMKDSAVQTIQTGTRTQSMQTEEINIDDRLRRIAPHLLPSALVPKEKDTEPAPILPRRSSRRTQRAENGPITAPKTRDPGSGTATIYSSSQVGDELDHEDTSEKRKTLAIPNQTFNYDEFPHSSGDEDFMDDADHSGNEYRTALSPPKPRKQRNNLSINTGRPSPVPVIPLSRKDTIKRPSNIRKNAMVSSGVNAHSLARSPSIISNRTSESGGLKIGPPFPVPIRHSSRRTTLDSDRAHSPTPRVPRGNTRPNRQQSVRKVRSAAALTNVRDRNRSPPPLSISSAAPDSPELPPPLPKDEILSPTFDRQRLGQIRHRRQQASTNTSTTGKASVASSTQQTSVVDAIAQTMVGEWMWKYVRRRKSFGVADSPQNEEATAGGQRHKRWVWLAPYERAVMWSSRQPTSGSALLGKSGRKRKRSIFNPSGGTTGVLDKMLTNKVLIQSVLDVKDETPMPKNNTATQPIFNRSILILTPARALKFTAPNRERHYVWLTALSFLSHSPPGSEGLLSLPPPMPFEYEQLQMQQAEPVLTMPAPPPIPTKSSYAFSPIRDSVRLAKGKSRGDRLGGLNALSHASSFRSDSIPEMQEGGIAEPPTIPRYPGHSRRRSNTTNARPQTRGTSHGYERSLTPHGGPPSISNGDYYYGVGGVGITSRNSSLSHGSSAGAGSWESGAMGTVRMEAFVDRKPQKAESQKFEFDEEDEEDEFDRPSSYRLRRERKPSKLESYFGVNGDFYNGNKAAGDEEFWRNEDPFRGF